jgi:myo-inositol-1(or 4)-monophosphatase
MERRSGSGDERAEVLALARRLALDAGAIQRDRYETAISIETKSSSIDLVTEVDRACEALIVEAIEASRPKDAILAEEGGGSDSAGARWRWVIDPLDGTTNFAHGFPRFCVSIGVELEGVREVGVVYDPLLDELYHAVRGGGAFLGDRRLAVSKRDTLGNALVATGFAYDVHRTSHDNAEMFASMLGAARGIRRDGSAALDLCYVAAGRLDAYWELKLRPWDVAAGILFVEEAGGLVTGVERASGRDMTGAIDGAALDAGSYVSVLATNGLLHEQVLQRIGSAAAARGNA